MSQIFGNEAIRELISPISSHLNEQGLTELVINKPGIISIETNNGWQEIKKPELTYERLMTLASSIASYNDQIISDEKPLFSGMLPDEERVQIVIPPAVPVGSISITIRKPGSSIKEMKSYVEDGLFENVKWSVSEIRANHNSEDGELMQFLQNKKYDEFFENSVKYHKNICVVGDTGSGKTTFMKTICQFIPKRERIITIEDVRELFIDHNNIVHLIYSKGGQGKAKVSPADLIASCMRMKPDRVLLAELRGSESYDFLKLLTTGHSGSITSYHAASCQDAMARFVLMAKEHIEAAAYQDVALKRLMMTAIDIVCHVKAIPIIEDGRQIGKKRIMTEIYYDPFMKERIAYET